MPDKPGFVARHAYRFRLLGIVPILAACTVEPAPGPGGRPPPRPPVACTMEFAPVCGERGARRQTFPNACEARSNGFFIVARGECRRAPPPGPDRPDRPDGPDRPGRPDRPDREPERMCTMEYAPVCAERRGRLRTFPNACSAGNDGYRVVRPGECRR